MKIDNIELYEILQEKVLNEKAFKLEENFSKKTIYIENKVKHVN